MPAVTGEGVFVVGGTAQLATPMATTPTRTSVVRHRDLDIAVTLFCWQCGQGPVDLLGQIHEHGTQELQEMAGGRLGSDQSDLWVVPSG
jgi:hypothetical protein